MRTLFLGSGYVPSPRKKSVRARNGLVRGSAIISHGRSVSGS